MQCDAISNGVVFNTKRIRRTKPRLLQTLLYVPAERLRIAAGEGCALSAPASLERGISHEQERCAS